jgi:hypothetical protein
LYINLLIILLFANRVQAEITDSVSVNKSADSIQIKSPTYHALLVGMDIVKLGYNLLDKNKMRVEAIAEYKWKGSTWLSAEYGFCGANFNGNAVKYNSVSNAVSFGVSKAFFESKNSKDIDNAFVGVQLGAALSTTKNISYQINDIWGSTIGTLPNETQMVYFTGITGGFRFKIAKKIAIGWRAKGKILINPAVFKSISPIYIALYGKGDKATIFDYNLFLCWHLY